MENERNLVELSKRRLIKLHGVQKLGKNAMETIIRSLNPKATLDSTNHLATYLPSRVCDEIFQHLLVEMKQIPEINKRECLEKIDFLLTEKTMSLDLSDVLPKRMSNTVKNYVAIDDDELELVQSVIDKVKNQAPSIVYVVFNNIRLLRYYTKHLEFIDDLTNFKQLKILEMILIDLGTTQVLNLCRNLPQLQILEINSFDERYSDVEREEKIRQSLGNLRLLVGHTDERGKREIQQQFPNLNLASYLQHRVVMSTFRPVKHEDFLVKDIGTPPQRKYFSCGNDWFDSPDMVIHLKHPDVTYLEINFQYAKEIPSTTLKLPEFSKIKTLIARNCTDGTIITDILRIYGHGLRSLLLQSRDQQSFDVKILEFCPKLETIQLDRILFTDTSIQLVNLPRLNELYLIHNRYEVGSLLPIIMSSPHLQKFEIFGRFVNECLKELNTMVSESQILQELESIKILTVSHRPDAFRELLNLIENLSAFLPKLKDLQFVYNGQDYVGLANRYKREHRVAHLDQIRDIIVNNETLVPILESFSKLRT